MCSVLAQLREHSMRRPHVLSDAQLCRWTESIEDGVRVGRWGPIVDPNAPASRIALLSYFEPPAPLFAMDGPIGGGMIVTEELAERVVAAGIEDIEFIRIDGERGRTENEYRPST